MLYDNDPNNPTSKRRRRYKPALPPVTKEELELLLTKRFVTKQDVMRIFNLRDTDNPPVRWCQIQAVHNIITAALRWHTRFSPATDTPSLKTKAAHLPRGICQFSVSGVESAKLYCL